MQRGEKEAGTLVKGVGTRRNSKNFALSHRAVFT